MLLPRTWVLKLFKMIMRIRKDAYWFGEAQGRVVVSVNESRTINAFIDFMEQLQVPYSEIGKVTANEIIIDNENWGRIHEWKDKI